MKKLFTEEQEIYIRNNYNNMSYSDLANNLGVTYSQINGWINNHIDNKKDKRVSYSKEDEIFILNNYQNMTYREIAKKLNKNEKDVKAKAENMGLIKLREFNDRYFKNIDTPNKAYWLGFIYADGYIIHNDKNNNYGLGIEINRNDRYILENFNLELGGAHSVVNRDRDILFNGYEYTSNTSFIRIYSKNIVEDLECLNIYQNKTNIDLFPICKNYFLEFVRGFMDGDGCIYIGDRVSALTFTNSNYYFLDYIKNHILSLLNIDGSIYKENDKKYILSYHKKKNMKIKIVNICKENMKNINPLLALFLSNKKVIMWAKSVNAKLFKIISSMPIPS